MTSLNLGCDDLRIIGHAINWQLNVPYEQTAPPQLDERASAVLFKLLKELSALNRAYLVNGETAKVELGQSDFSSTGNMRLSPSNFRLMTDAVASFHQELRSSPAELEVVTGLPSSKTSQLLLELETMCQSSLSCS